MSEASYSLAALARYFLKLGTIGFGGPVALVGYMYRDLVETRHWIGDDDYKEGLTLAQLMPGPLAAQLAMYLGYVHFRVVGATIAGVAFVLPSFLMVVAIGWATGHTVAQLTGAGTVADRAQCAARPTNDSGTDDMCQALLHFLELDDYLNDQAIPPPFEFR